MIYWSIFFFKLKDIIINARRRFFNWCKLDKYTVNFCATCIFFKINLSFSPNYRTRAGCHYDGENKEGRRDEEEEGTGGQLDSGTNKRTGEGRK